ncbi:SDR family NAD(P)-dependent oxidoreductase [Streptomyces sp. NPDC093675]|uniref:SDR family NAD(P)-dependent oxidoreductase n=1 Tax=Streptomyces sp. NPDC093675 TaxID=3366049 RepID=UPI0037F632B6
MHCPVQQPIGSGFTAANTALEVVAGVDLTGKTAVVTGGHSGVGLETTRALSAAGAQVVVPVRDPAKGRARLAGAGDNIEVDRLDLAEPASVDDFAARFVASGRPLHILVNSAGIMGVPLTRDNRGYEAHFATNHLGHFQLVRQLWPALAAAGGARVVNVAAWAHRMSPIVFDDPMFEHRGYEWILAYGQSKTANILHAVEITARGTDDGIEAFAVHPGAIPSTDLSPWATPDILRAMDLMDEDGNWVIDPEAGKKTPQQGASTQTWMATDPRLTGLGGVYGENNEVSPLVALPEPDDLQALDVVGKTPPGVVPHALDPDAADRLWDLSERLVPGTGIR